MLVNQLTTLEVGRSLCKFCISKNSFMCLLYLNKNVRNHSSVTHDTRPITTLEGEAATEQCNITTSSHPPLVPHRLERRPQGIRPKPILREDSGK